MIGYKYLLLVLIIKKSVYFALFILLYHPQNILKLLLISSFNSNPYQNAMNIIFCMQYLTKGKNNDYHNHV